MPKDKYGNKLTWKEFMQRWREGIEGITPAQQARTILNSTWISLIGILCGISVCLFNFKSMWWVLIILVGAFFVTGTSQVGNYQKYIAHKRMEDLMNNQKEVETNVNEQERVH